MRSYGGRRFVFEPRRTTNVGLHRALYITARSLDPTKIAQRNFLQVKAMSLGLAHTLHLGWGS